MGVMCFRLHVALPHFFAAAKIEGAFAHRRDGEAQGRIAPMCFAAYLNPHTVPPHLYKCGGIPFSRQDAFFNAGSSPGSACPVVETN